jgi:exosortase/archaeosortase family protein
MAGRPTHAIRFLARAVAGSLGVFGLLRVNWIEAHLVLPLSRAQGVLAAGLFGAPTTPVEATVACSGSEALALCLGVVLAYPVSWRMRLAGAGGGVGLIVSLNTLRIGTLGRVAPSPSWFSTFHLDVWPALLTLAIAGYVLMWMRLADRPPAPAPREHGGLPLAPAFTGRPQPTRRFIVLSVLFLLVFSGTSPLYLESPTVLALASFIAGMAALILNAFGVTAHAAANVLWTSRAGFLVTQECISTPLIPLYLAGVCAYSTTWRRLIPGILGVAPLFIALGIARLLVVALPGVVASPIFFVHAFYQLLLGAAVVFIAALWRHGGRPAIGRGLAGVVVGVLFVFLPGPFYTRAITWQAGATLDDPQGAIALLPAFQIGLFLALWVAAFIDAGWKRVLAGLGLLALTQTAGLLALDALGTHAGLMASVRDIRGWAVVAPVLVLLVVTNRARPGR